MRRGDATISQLVEKVNRYTDGEVAALWAGGVRILWSSCAIGAGHSSTSMCGSAHGYLGLLWAGVLAYYHLLKWLKVSEQCGRESTNLHETPSWWHSWV